MKKKFIKDGIDLIVSSTAPWASFVVKMVRWGEEAALAEQKVKEHAGDYFDYLDNRCKTMKKLISETKTMQKKFIEVYEKAQNGVSVEA